MNWGTKLALGMLTFMLFIIAMACYMFSKLDADALVAADYYEKGLQYDQDISARRNVIADGVKPKITITGDQLIIQMKDSTDYELKLIRPSAAKKDMSKAGKTLGDAHLILVDASGLAKGLWLLELKWGGKKKYFHQQHITL